jgi:hypothetical protein
MVLDRSERPLFFLQFHEIFVKLQNFHFNDLAAIVLQATPAIHLPIAAHLLL